MHEPLDQSALAQLFTEARSHNGWLDQPVPDSLLEAIYNLTKIGPTSANCSPARFVFVRTRQGKEMLKPCLLLCLLPYLLLCLLDRKVEVRGGGVGAASGPIHVQFAPNPTGAH